MFHHLRVVYLLVGTLTIFYIMDLSSIFSYVNRYIYNKISPYIYTTAKRDRYILVDANNLTDDELKRLISIISKYNPKKIIADTFHYHQLSFNTKKITLAIPTFIQIDKGISRYPIFKYHLYNNFIYKTNRTKNFLVNFNGKLNSANIYDKSILNNYIEDKTFTNKIVIVSDFNNNYSFDTLLPFKSKDFTHQKYLAYLYNSATKNIWLISFRGYYYYIFITIYILVGAFLIYIFYEYAITTAVVIITITFISYYLLVSFYYILLPISEMLFLLFFIFTYLVYYREITIIVRENRLNRNIALSLDKKNVYTSFFNSKNSWEEISNIINELFLIERAVFFEKLDDKKMSLKESYSINCSSSDILEKIQEYTAEPYLSTLKKRKAIVIDRKFFKTKKSSEYEIIAPLIYYNDILGFWVFSIEKDNIKDIDTLLEEVTLCSTEIARLLFEKKRFIKNRLQSQKRLFLNKIIDFIHIEIDDTSAKNIERNFTVLLKKFYTKDIIFNKTEASIILYDFFGRVISANSNIEKLSKQRNINLYSLNATKFLHKISNIEYQQSIEIIKSVIYHQSIYEDIICFDRYHRYLIRVSPVTKEHISNRFNENFFMGVYGILFEMIDLGIVDLLSIPILNATKSCIEYNRSQIDRLKSLLNPDRITQDIINHIYNSYKIVSNSLESDCKSSNHTHLVNILYLIEFITTIFINRYLDAKIDIDDSQIKNKEAFVHIDIKEFSIYMIEILKYLTDTKHIDRELEIGFREFREWSMVYIKNNSYSIPREDLIKSLKLERDSITFEQLKDKFKEFGMEIDIDSNLIDGIVIKLFFKESKVYE